MIDELHVQDVALIHDATIRPASDLTVLTGETGTGKTALLSAIKLLMGERADAGVVREGADALSIEARLYLEGADPEGVIVRRRVEASGRGKVEIDGKMASVRELGRLVGSSIDLCGQHEHQKLMQPKVHAEMLDAWGGGALADVLAKWKEAFAEHREAADALSRLERQGRAAQEDLDEASFVLARIDEVAPDEREYERLERELPVAEHAESLIMAAAGSHEALSGEDGISDRLNTVIEDLREASAFDGRLARLADALESAQIDIDDISGQLRDYRDGVDFDPETLSQMQERMAALQGIMRTYGPRISDVIARREQAAAVVDAVQGGDERLREARKRFAGAEAALDAAAKNLNACRKAAAPELSAAVTRQMASLKMGSAELEVEVKELPKDQWSSAGPSTVEFLYRPGASLEARPLRRIASGGEISRVMLACKVVLGDADSAETLVFDEVDAGVGGATAVALADVLARLARSRQVIVVTHLAQVAVRASKQYVVTKRGTDTPESEIQEVVGESRVREIARMLSGDETETSLAHAREMLKGSGGR